MNCNLNCLLIALVIISIKNVQGQNPSSVFRSTINSLLSDLQSKPIDAILYWNSVALQACANDYDKSLVSIPDQNGPTTTSRALAIIHGAMYDSMSAFGKRSKQFSRYYSIPYTNRVRKDLAIDAAIMESAYRTLSAMYPRQRIVFYTIRRAFYNQLRSRRRSQHSFDIGILVGRLVAFQTLDERKYDDSSVVRTYTPIPYPGYHQPDPTAPNQGFLGANWGSVKPFLLDYGAQYRPSSRVGDSPEARQQFMNTIEYISNYYEVKSYGSRESVNRTADQTEIGIYWAYDGAPKLGVPPRLYNQIARTIAIQQNNSKEENARLFAIVNYAMADAGIAAWECKYYYNLWRPIVGIRQASGATQGDPNWLPLGAPSDNNGNNFTPGFPSYVSGHSTFGSALFESLRLFYKTDNIRFEFQSDEYNGRTYDSVTKQIRPAKTRRFRSFTHAEDENYLSRIYLGVHWRIDQEEGKILGRKVAQHVFNRV